MQCRAVGTGAAGAYGSAVYEMFTTYYSSAVAPRKINRTISHMN